MLNVTQSAYTSPTTGKRFHTVLVCGCAYAAPREDEGEIAEIALAVFKNHPGHARLLHWEAIRNVKPCWPRSSRTDP